MPPSLKSGDFKVMIESAPEAIIVYNVQTFLYLNPFASERLGGDATSLGWLKRARHDRQWT